MKMTMYYVVRQYSPEDTDVEFVSGPFAFYSQAFESREDQSVLNQHQLQIVESTVEVK